MCIRDSSDPFSQPDLKSLGINPEKAKGFMSLISPKFKYPTVFRTSLSAEKKLHRDWNIGTEILFTKNIHEGKYTNINLLPPARKTSLPGSRNVFSLNTNPEFIPMPGGNPYTNIYLLGNNK